MEKMQLIKSTYPLVRVFLLPVLIIGLLAAGSAFSTEQTLQATSQPVKAAASSAPQNIADTSSCGKCGMLPAKYPQWHSQIIFTDGSMIPFDGCKCMFGFLLEMAQYDKQHTRADVAAVWVKDFLSGEWLAADSANFVVGSDVMGPMGKELIPFAERLAAVKFQQEHGGSLELFDKITMATLQPLSKGHMKIEMPGGHGKM